VTAALMRAMGRMVDQLGGDYLAGFDVGTTLEDMEPRAGDQARAHAS
jgi:hypothetical protein